MRAACSASACELRNPATPAAGRPNATSTPGGGS